MIKSEYLAMRAKYQFSISARKLIEYLFVDAALILAIVFLNKGLVLGWKPLLSVPLIVILMSRNFAMMHEAVHSVSAKSTLVNFMMGWWCGSLSLLPYEAWKRVHLKHHYWTGNIQQDPVMALMIEVPKFPGWKRELIDALWKAWVPVVAYLQHVVFWQSSVREVKKDPQFKMLFSVVAPIALWGSLLIFMPIGLVLTVILPSVFLYLVLVEVVNFPHHLELVGEVGDFKLSLWNQYEATRSCVYPRWVEKFVTLNFNYHNEHHVFPDAPYYELRNIQKDLMSHLGAKYNVDYGMGWILKNRKLKFSAILQSSKSNKTKDPKVA